MARKNRSKSRKIGAVGRAVGQFLLDQLLALGEIFPQPFETPYAYKRRLSGWPKEIPAWRVRQEIIRLKKKGWIQEAEKHGKKFLRLTRKGKMEALYKKLKKIDLPPKKVWDGKWRMAIFDIPEKGRRERDAIRGALKLAGFHQLQKSVYVYPFELPAEMVDYLKHAGLLSFIRFVRIDRIDSMEEIKKFFKL